MDYVEGVVEALANYIGVPYTPPGENIDTPTDLSVYVVKRGDTLYGIARKFGVSLQDLKNRNNLVNDSISIGQQLYIPGIQDVIVDPSAGTYTVAKGDTLYSIAGKYGISVDELMTMNNLTNNNISIGQQLFIPTDSSNITPPIESDITVYTVSPGDTLYSISRLYNTTVDDIISLNNLDNYILTVGQTLKIPDSTSKKEYIVYTVQRGDSLYSIAKKYGVSVDDLKTQNNLSTNLITIGQQLTIPITI